MKNLRHLSALMLFALLPLWGWSQADTVLFSAKGGFYEDAFHIELFNYNPQNHIRYTINGNRPTAQSPLYEGPMRLDESLYSSSDIYTIPMSAEHLVYVPDSVQHCIVIRAAVFDENDNCVSHVATNSYFIKALGCDTHGLPAVSLCADSLDLFGYEQGILVPGVYFNPQDPEWSGNFYQSGLEWERRANIEFYEPDDNTGINQTAGLRTHGGNARRGPQKGLKVYARQEYGAKRFRHAFFKSIPNNSFKHLVLKPFVDEWFWAGIENNISQRMARDVNVESLATRPSVLFLNGEYWGIYTVCERPDAHYLEDHFGYNDEEINVIGSWHGENENGDNSAFLQMMDWLEDADLSDSTNYAHLCSLIDIDCFIDYYCLELFIANSDWPVNNMRCYQFHNRKWRWIFYDGDNGLQDMDFDVFDNATSTLNPGWPNDLKSTLMFRRLLENPKFRARFQTRLAALMDGPFGYENTRQYLEAEAALMRDEVPNQAARFNRPNNIQQWEHLVAIQDNFLRNRASNMYDRIDNYFSFVEATLSDWFDVYPNPSSGDIHLHVEIDSLSSNEIALYDLTGKKVFALTGVLAEGTNKITFHPQLSPGVYILKVGNYVQRIVRY